MRAPSADYSTLRRAISQKTQSETNSRLGDKIANATESLDIQGKKLDIQGKSLDLQAKSIKSEKTYNWVNMGISIAQQSLSAATKFYQLGKETYEKSQDDLVKETTTNISTDATIKINEAANGDGNTFIEDENGNLQDINVDPALESWFNDQITAVQNNKELGKAAKSQVIRNIETMRANAKAQVYTQYFNNKASALDVIEGDLLSKAVQTDVGATADIRSSYGDYASVDAYIASNSNWSLATKQQKTIDAHKAIDLGRAKNDIQGIAIAQGYDAAVSAARGYQQKYGWAPDSSEYKSLLSIAQLENANETQKIVNNASTAMTSVTQAISTGDTSVMPADAYKSIEENLKGQPQDRIDAAKQAAKEVHIAWAQEQTLAVMGNYSSATRDELILEQSVLEEMNNKGFFDGGAENVYNSAQKTVSSAISSWDSYYGSSETASKQEIAARVSATKACADTIVKQFGAGLISAEAAITQLQSFLDESNNIKESYEDDAHILGLVKNINNEIVPDEYKDTINAYLDRFSVNYASILGYPVNNTVTSASGQLSALNESQMSEVKTARDEAYAAVANLCRQTAHSSLSPKMIDDKLQSISDMYTAKTFKALSSGVEEATFFKGSQVKDTLNAFGEHPDIVYYDSTTGENKWVNSKFQESYDEVADWCAQDLEAKGIVLKTDLTELYKKNGVVKPFPVFTTADDKKILYSNEGIFILGSDGSMGNSPTEENKENLSDVAKQSRDEALKNLGVNATASKPNPVFYPQNVVSKTDVDKALEVMNGAKEEHLNYLDEDVLANMRDDAEKVTLAKAKDINEGANIASSIASSIPNNLSVEVDKDGAISLVSTSTAESKTEESWIKQLFNAIGRAFNGVN